VYFIYDDGTNAMRLNMDYFEFPNPLAKCIRKFVFIRNSAIPIIDLVINPNAH